MGRAFGLPAGREDERVVSRALSAARGVFRRWRGGRTAAHPGFGFTRVSGKAPANTTKIPPGTVGRHEAYSHHRQRSLFVLVVPAVDFDAPFRRRLRRDRDPSGPRKYTRAEM